MGYQYSKKPSIPKPLLSDRVPPLLLFPTFLFSLILPNPPILPSCLPRISLLHNTITPTMRYTQPSLPSLRTHTRHMRDMATLRTEVEQPLSLNPTNGTNSHYRRSPLLPLLPQKLPRRNLNLTTQLRHAIQPNPQIQPLHKCRLARRGLGEHHLRQRLRPRLRFRVCGRVRVLPRRDERGCLGVEGEVLR